MIFATVLFAKDYLYLPLHLPTQPLLRDALQPNLHMLHPLPIHHTPLPYYSIRDGTNYQAKKVEIEEVDHEQQIPLD